MSDHLALNVDRLKRPESTDEEEEEHGDVDCSDQLLIPTMAKCRICQEEDSINSLETPCGCSGSLKTQVVRCNYAPPPPPPPPPTQQLKKLGELGYHRNAKKCKEKFENVYKYHKRTKDSRTAKSEGKNYRFFEQLQALDHHHHNHLITNSTPPNTLTTSTTTVPLNTNTVPIVTTTMPQTLVTNPSPILPPATANTDNLYSSPSLDISTSSYTSSDVEIRDGGSKRKRKWKDFLEKMTNEMVKKQEELQRKFLETIEKRERERIVREDAWRMQEMTRFNREREILAQERSMAAAKDAALMAFLQKISDQQNLKPPPNSTEKQQTKAVNNIRQPEKPTPTPPLASPAPPVVPPSMPIVVVPPVPQAGINIENSKTDNGGANSSSRWPKVEILALIKLRTNLDLKYQENGPKGPLWEEISAGMRNIGYNRNPKRCKEKWENINKYYKKVKESNKKRPEDSKTCPYFDELDALYKDKNKLINHNDHQGSNNNNNNNNNNVNWSNSTTQINSVPLVVQPEQQWPPGIPQHDSVMEDQNSDEEDENDYTDKDEDEDENGGGGYEIVANNKQPSVNVS
ncbi:hypothetical protein ACFE04_025422 [Oxalis oulophora]